MRVRRPVAVERLIDAEMGMSAHGDVRKLRYEQGLSYPDWHAV